MNYPYHLGCHLKTGRLCRIPHSDFGIIPPGFARIIWYMEKKGSWRYNPYDVNNDLDLRYYSIVRWSDIQRELGEKVTGPNIAMMLIRP